MTSGQGQHGDPQGQPPPWQQPGPPPYGQPGPPPWGYPSAPPGYGPPPPGYGPPPPGYPVGPPGYRQPPPEPKERPLLVRAGLGAFVVSIVLGVAGSVFSLANWDEYIARSVAQQPQFQDPEFQRSGIDPASFVEGLSTLFFVGSLVFAALYALFVWFAWRGHNWARIVLFVLGGLGIAGGLINLAGIGSSPFPFLTALSLFSFVAVLTGVVLLARKPSSEWYAHEKWRRAMTP
jgi:hypothetical protein